MPLADDASLLVHAISLRRDYLARHGNIAVREANAIELNLQIPFPHKMPRLFVRFQVSAQITAAWKNCPAKLPQGAQVANHRIANVCGCRGKIWFIERASQ